MTMLSVNFFCAVAGVILALIAGHIAVDATHPRRVGSALFWGLLGGIFVFGPVLPPVLIGYLVLALVLLAAAKQVSAPRLTRDKVAEKRAHADRHQNRLFLPVLLIPATAILGSFVFNHLQLGQVRLLSGSNTAITAVSLGALLALLAAMRLTRARPAEPLAEGSRLLQLIGSVVILPQLLAVLGGIFTLAGTGTVVAGLMEKALPMQYPFVAVAAYCLGMLLFTVCMGNAFAAFSVITAGIGLPFVVRLHGGNPAIMAALGMLSGYCGTLLTPMAANFNIVPVLLLELKDRNAVIKAQAPLAIAVFVFNVLLMGACVYRF
jgi:uncharacterized membrane protein